ncbi:MAG: ABC transporter [Pseudomonadota bacterium]|nr:ABC transporter [Pseudomonadota bacterium]
MPRPRTRLAATLLLILAAVLAWAVLSRSAEPQRPVALFTSLPIFWGEEAELGDLLKQDRPPHWAKAAIAAHGPIRPLDTLDQLGPELRRLVIAQPRPLSPAENVALDNWVRGGGQLLLLADPALTEESAFPIGDKRRPQDIVLLSPILRRWGLELTFDDSRERIGDGPVDVDGLRLTLNMPGHFVPFGTERACRISREGVLADCRIGQGRALILADAAVIERDDPGGLRQQGFESLLRRAFVNP